MKGLCCDYDTDGLPILTYDSMDDYATSLLKAHAPEAFEEDAFLDIQGFVRRALGCRIACHTLSRDASVQAAAFFTDSYPTFYDDGREKKMHVLPKTIIIDPSLLDHPYVARFKLAHEAGHLLLHGGCVRAGSMVTEQTIPIGRRIGTLSEMEKQANWFAECLMMNRSSTLSYWERLRPELFRRFGDRRETAESYAVSAVAGAFRVSRYAAVRRLQGLGLVRTNANCH